MICTTGTVRRTLWEMSRRAARTPSRLAGTEASPLSDTVRHGGVGGWVADVHISPQSESHCYFCISLPNADPPLTRLTSPPPPVLHINKWRHEPDRSGRSGGGWGCVGVYVLQKCSVIKPTVATENEKKDIALDLP